MDWKRKIAPDHTDQAYREAVSRLRTMLSPRPQSRSSILGSPIKTIDKPHISALESPEMAKKGMSNSIRSMLLKDSTPTPSILNNNPSNIYSSVGYKPPPPITSDYATDREDDLFGFIEKQGEYITQLEKETKYCRDELSTMLEKVREVISENEALHEQQKKDIITSMIKQLDEKTPSLETPRQSGTGKKSNLSGAGSSNVILESRVAEMDAQLSQARRSLRLAQEEILDLRKGKLKELTEGGGGAQPSDSAVLATNPYAHCELHRDEIDRISREKNDLVETLTKLKSMMNELKDRETDAAKKVKSSVEIIEHMRVEKDQSDMETGRLKEELDRYQKRVREMIQDHTRKLHEEKLQVERKYRQELDHLSSEMTQELDSLTRARIDLERQKRVETDLRRELEQKHATIEDLRQEMQIKMGHLQKELTHALSQKSTVEQDLINSRLNAEKMERDGKQDAMRLQAEINALRKRLEQSDVELVKSQDMVAKMNESLSQYNREASLAKLRLEDHLTGDPSMQDKNVMGLIQDMEEKHSRDMTELEQLLQVQNNLLDKLRGECKVLTDKLEDTHRNYKEELMSGLQSCVASFRNEPTVAPGGIPPLESDSNPDIQKLEQQLEDFLKNQTALVEELIVILQEMNESISSDDTKEAKKSESEVEKKEEDDDKTGQEVSEFADDNPKTEQSDEVSEKKEEEKKEEDGKVKEDDKKDDEKKENENDDKKDEEEKSKDSDSDKKQDGEEGKENDSTASETPAPKEKESTDEKSAKTEAKDDDDDFKTVSETDLKFKVMEMNSQLQNWAKRIESIIERFSNSSPNKVDS
ncbi:unnamed protein product [Orchesella dallaii]|uniref:Uncharacterized protein n=1 Tax=Orchesella dallaii TaxID=48710 RepID=A0ABP1QY88_9HEXA